ncbi:MAG: hypothetical protein BMS9Abin01_2290 [Gammaproteobacteria bacterium]|nr:MAG: hypothetical protein BMS9Abin01_2290 [Gammaproteobacteria bacterium]
MKRRTLTIVVLLLVVAGLAVFIALTPDKQARLALEPLGSESPRAVSRIRLKLGEGATMELRRTDGVWQLVEPIRIAANNFRVQGLLRVLEAPVHARIDAAPQQLARFGLAPARARLLLDETEILFGDTEPLYGRRYLLYDGKVALVDDAYFSHLSSSAANYVNLALLGRDPQPRNIVLPDFRVYRDAGNWRLDSDHGKVAAESITRLVDTWRHAQATAVRPYQPSLDWNDVIRVELADGDRRFDLARTEYELILGRPDLGIQYHLTKGTGARLLGFASPDG